MFPKYKKILNFEVAHFNEKELKLLQKEIFSNEIYKIKLDKNIPKIIDAGAYIGLSTLYFKTIYPKAKILSFEPNPNIFPLLEENIEINDLKGVTLKKLALGNKKAIRNLYIDSSNNYSFSTSSFIKDAWNGEQHTSPIEVKVEKLSDYISENVDLLKMDIEGAEKEVLEELRDSNKLHLIRNIIFEFHPSKINQLNHLKNILSSNNMDITIKEGLEGKKDPLILVIGKEISN